MDKMRSRTGPLRDDGRFLLWVIVVLPATISLLVLILAKNEEQILALERRTNVPFLGRLTEDVSSKRSAALVCKISSRSDADAFAPGRRERAA